MPVKKLEILLRDEHSKTNTRKIAHMIIKEEVAIKTVFEVIKKNEKPYSQRAAWILSTVEELQPRFLDSNYAETLNLVDRKYHDAVLRSSLKVLSCMRIKEKDMSKLFDKSTSLIKSKNTAVAIKLWALDVAIKIADKHPELFQEIKFYIDENVKNASPGWKNKIKNTLQSIEQQQHEKY
jgi:hypothetical protein